VAIAAIYACIFSDMDPVKRFPLHLAAQKLVSILGKLVQSNVKAVSATGWISGVIDAWHQKRSHLNDFGVHVVRSLLESGMNVAEATWAHILPAACAMIPNQAMAVWILSALGQFLPCC
jgi:linoleate 10R-lipoxygenase